MSGVRHTHERRTLTHERHAVSSRKVDEPVRLTKIYTRGGDGGSTSLGDMSRASKLDPLVRAYGAVDELNSVLGWARVAADAPELERIQNELFDLGADLSVPYVADDGKLRIDQPAIDRLEADCDAANAPLPELRSFILPGGSEAAGAPPHRTLAVPPRRARGARRPSGASREPARARLPEPTQRSALHSRARCERGRWRAALEARRRTFDDAVVSASGFQRGRDQSRDPRRRSVARRSRKPQLEVEI